MRSTLDLLFAMKFLEDDRLRKSHRSTLFALLAYREKNGESSPAIRQAADVSGADDKSVRSALQDLETWGYVTCRRRKSKGRHLSNVYEVILPETGVLPETGGVTSPPTSKQVLAELAVLPETGVGAPESGGTYPAKREGVLPETGPSEDLLSDPSKDLPAEGESAREGVLGKESEKSEKLARTDSHRRDVGFLWRLFVWSEPNLRGNRTGRLPVEEATGYRLIGDALHHGHAVDNIGLAIVGGAIEGQALISTLANVQACVGTAQGRGWAVERDATTGRVKGLAIVERAQQRAAGGAR